MVRAETRAADRIDRLSVSANAGAKIGALIDDPDVKRQLDAIERGLIEDVLKQQTSDLRDQAAAEVRALRKVRAALAALANGGKHAEAKLAQLTKDTSHG